MQVQCQISPAIQRASVQPASEANSSLFNWLFDVINEYVITGTIRIWNEGVVDGIVWSRDKLRWEFTNLNYLNPFDENFRKIDSVRKEFAFRVLYCQKTKHLPSLLPSPSPEEQKIVQYTIFVRVTTKLDKIIRKGVMGLDLGAAVNEFDNSVKLAINCPDFLVRGIVSPEPLKHVIEDVKEVHEIASRNYNPADLELRIQEVTSGVEHTFCWLGKQYVSMTSDTMEVRAKRLIKHYQTAHAEATHLLSQEPNQITESATADQIPESAALVQIAETSESASTSVITRNDNIRETASDRIREIIRQAHEALFLVRVNAIQKQIAVIEDLCLRAIAEITEAPIAEGIKASIKDQLNILMELQNEINNRAIMDQPEARETPRRTFRENATFEHGKAALKEARQKAEAEIRREKDVLNLVIPRVNQKLATQKNSSLRLAQKDIAKREAIQIMNRRELMVKQIIDSAEKKIEAEIEREEVRKIIKSAYKREKRERRSGRSHGTPTAERVIEIIRNERKVMEIILATKPRTEKSEVEKEIRALFRHKLIKLQTLQNQTMETPETNMAREIAEAERTRPVSILYEKLRQSLRLQKLKETQTTSPEQRTLN